MEKNHKMKQILIDRGMSVEECKALCTSPIVPLESKVFFRSIYELTFRPFEVQHILIENYNSKTGEITAQTTKVKYNPRTKTKTMQPRSMILSPKTNEMMKAHISQRKKGFIFLSEINPKKPKSLRYFEKQITKYAKLISIQKKKQITEKGRTYGLVTLMALREAGERHHDQEGGDPSISAKASGHTMTVKNKFYKKGSFEEAQRSFQKNHPAFKEDWD